MKVDRNSIGYDQRFGITDTVGEGNEFNVAVKSVHDAHPELPIYLITNAKYLDSETMKLIYRIYNVDLLKESGLDKLYEQTGDTKFGFGTKAYSILAGWKMRVLPEYVIYFDVDIVIIEVTQRWNLYTMFDVLKVLL